MGRSPTPKNRFFGERLRLILKKKGISQTALAEHLGVTKVAVSNYVRCATEPCLQYLVLIAQFLDVSTDYLLGNTTIVHVKKKAAPGAATPKGSRTKYDGAIVAHNGGKSNYGNQN